MCFYNYLVYEEDLVNSRNGSVSDDESGDENVMGMDSFAKEKHHAYKTSVLLALNAILKFTPVQFRLNANWMTGFLSRLIVCESLEIRLCIREIYRTFVNPLILK